MDTMAAWARDQEFPSWFSNALGKAMSLAAEGFMLELADATHVRVPAGVNGTDDGVMIAIKGLWRWNEAAVTIAHPGGAAGEYPIFVTAKNNDIVDVPVTNTDATDYSFALQILPPGDTPTIVAGVVDVYRRVGTVAWDGAAITGIEQLVPPVGSHADRHATAGPDPLVKRVTALPSHPYDGQTVDFVADAANGVIWRFCYNAGSASAYKWEFIGGSKLSVMKSLGAFGGGALLPSPAYGDLVGVGGARAQIVLPLGGDFDVTVIAPAIMISDGSGNEPSVYISFTTNAAAQDADAVLLVLFSNLDPNVGVNGQRTIRKPAIPGGTTLTVQGRQQNSSGGVTNHAAYSTGFGLIVQPVRVG